MSSYRPSWTKPSKCRQNRTKPPPWSRLCNHFRRHRWGSTSWSYRDRTWRSSRDLLEQKEVRKEMSCAAKRSVEDPGSAQSTAQGAGGMNVCPLQAHRDDRFLTRGERIGFQNFWIVLRWNPVLLQPLGQRRRHGRRLFEPANVNKLNVRRLGTIERPTNQLTWHGYPGFRTQPKPYLVAVVVDSVNRGSLHSNGWGARFFNFQSIRVPRAVCILKARTATAADTDGICACWRRHRVGLLERMASRRGRSRGASRRIAYLASAVPAPRTGGRINDRQNLVFQSDSAVSIRSATAALVRLTRV